MKLALNYSPEAERLVRQGLIQVDYFKCPDWPELVTQAAASLPVYVHFPLHAGNRTVAETDWTALAGLRKSTDTPQVNLHLSATTGAFPQIPVDSREHAHLTAITAALVEDVSLAIDRFGAQSVIVENVIYRGPEGTVIYPAVAPRGNHTGCETHRVRAVA